MTQQELQRRLNQPYSTENWKEVVKEVFPNVQLLDPIQDIPVDNDKVESFRQLGNVKLNDGKSLALFELKLKNNVNLIRNRVELNNLVSQYIDQDQSHGVLSIFEQGGDDYRFTFSARATEFDEVEADFVTKKTDTKRFTYLLGKNESCKTPALRLYDLSTKKSNADMNTIQDAFSVEKLSKEFFKDYLVHYKRMVDYLTESPSYRSSIFKGDEKAIRDFVKLTLGRLVFIQFLQKKRWMGVPAEDQGWETGDPYFLKNSFRTFEYKDVFYSSFLEPLFFETLNKEGRPNQIFSITGTKVPYLNGGLFEKGKENSQLINFPAAFFEELFEFFDRYNFTIDESDPKEQEVGIDPEMLGHIFENLLEDNKDKGAFYTPKEIVHYMCQESLLEYLKTFLEEKGKWPTLEGDQHALEEAFSNFIKKKEGSGIIDYDRELAIALRDVKICDPAIGSGAFPMGLLNEIFHAVYILFQASPDVVGEVWCMDAWKPNVVKKNIIQNSIYGVDIEKGAVDIARLRFWLSLIVDEPEPEALPNLDYKIVVGNSLISKLEETVIDIDWNLDDTTHGLFGAGLAQQKGQLLDKLSAGQKEFFNSESDKQKLAVDIRNLKIDLLINQLELMVSTKGIHIQPTGTNRRIADQTAIYLQTLGWKDSIKQLQLLKTQKQKPLIFFDWKLDFPEILNESINTNPGFDIVIGNPPYGVSIKGEYRNEIVRKFGKVPDFEIYYFFIELAHRLTKVNGVKSYIIPNTFLFNTFAEQYRIQLLEKWHLVEILDCTKFNIFETATVRNAITLWKKEKNQLIGYKQTKNKDSFKLLSQSPRQLIKNEDLLKMNQNWGLAFFLEKSAIERVSKIKNSTINLEEFFPEISQGLIAYDKYQGQSKEIIESRAYHYFEKSKPELKKWLWGADVTRYKVEWNKKEYIDYCEGIANPRDPKYFIGERLLVREITNPTIFSGVTSEELYNDPSIIIVKSNTTFSVKSLSGILNSKLATYYHFNNSPKATKGAFPKILVKDIKEFPLPKDFGQKDILVTIVDYILWINAFDDPLTESIPNSHILTYFEEVIDALVLEMYFQEDFRKKGIDIENNANRMIKPFFGLSKAEQKNRVQETYQALREKENPLRTQIKLMKIDLKELVLPILSI